MKLISKTVIASLVLTAGIAVAKEGVQDPTVKARMELMSTIGANAKILGEMAGDKTAFDATAAAAAKTTLIASAAKIPEKFETEADDPVSEGRPDIWMDFDGFKAKAAALGEAAAAIDVASLDGVKAGMGAIGDGCKGCHTDYRAKK